MTHPKWCIVQLKSFDKIYSEFTDAEKKRFIGSFVERVEIYEEEQENFRV